MKYKSRQLLIFIIDIILLNISILFSYYIRFGGKVPAAHIRMHFKILLVVLGIKWTVFYLSGLYRRMWKYANMMDIMSIVAASLVSNSMVITYIYLSNRIVPRSIYMIAAMLDILLIGGVRLIGNVYKSFSPFSPFMDKGSKKRVMIVGAGDAGASVIEELLSHPGYGMIPVCAIDDDRRKKGRRLLGVPITGNRDDIVRQVRWRKVDEIFITIPSLNKAEIRKIIEECNKTGCSIKILPSLHEIIYDRVSIKKMRDVRVEDLLGREPVSMASEMETSYFKGKKVLVTGGGGSIGSEICRQIANFHPFELIILDICENGAYHIEQELKRKYEDLKITVLIGSTRDSSRVDQILEFFKPEVVFHAAAHKHVPLMEANPGEAVKNNITGTLNLVRAAHENKVDKFVLISTDKAVNPTNVMGATKRVCEMIIQAYSSFSDTEFAAVRFGNVLNSEGSVIPLFRQQIEEGGPVTVTHPDIIRYFMTIPEAVQLVIQAGIIAQGGEIFVLDMGEPVKIDKLARDLIRLSGYEPDKDIKIVYTGLRPGEKLYEELLLNEEGLEKTSNEKIYVEKPRFIDIDRLTEQIRQLEQLAVSRPEKLAGRLQEIIST